MNVFIGSGRVTRVNLLNGKFKMLKFTLAIAENNFKQEGEKIDYVPCIIYNPAEKVKNLISEKQEVELQGKVKTFSFEIAGEATYKTEVIINQNSVKSIE